MTLGYLLHVSHKFYIYQTVLVTSSQIEIKSMWLSLGNKALSELTACRMLMTTTTNMKWSYSRTLLRRSVPSKKNSWKTYFPRNEKMSTEKLLVPSCEMKEGMCKFVHVTVWDYLCMCVRLYICMCVRLLCMSVSEMKCVWFGSKVGWDMSIPSMPFKKYSIFYMYVSDNIIRVNEIF